MKIENIKQLQKVIALCAKNGVHSIKIDGIELLLTPTKSKTPVHQAPDLDFSSDIPEAGAKVPVFTPMKPTTAEEDNHAMQIEALTEEQLMFYSAAPAESAQ